MTSQNQNEKAAPQNEASDPVDGLLIDFPDLLPGDILLFRPIDPQLHQRKITSITGSPYTHAAIVIGDNKIAESVVLPPIVRKRSLSVADKEQYIIGVLRTQAVFSERRVTLLQEFVKSLTDKFTLYDVRVACGFKKRKEKFDLELQAKLEKDFGQVTTREEFIQRAYFCSALVVACYTMTDIIGPTAQLVYNPDVISPGDLHSDTSFGWFLGYIVSDKKMIPPDDPLLKITDWRSQTPWW